MPGAPAIPGARNWLPLGPTVVLEGQTVGGEPVGGRTVGLAVAAGGQRVYAASACGGVFRSDDGGTSWASMMDAFDIDPTNFASSSLACGAIAIDPADPDRVYVGTGEGETHEIFAARIVSALPAIAASARSDRTTEATWCPGDGGGCADVGRRAFSYCGGSRGASTLSARRAPGHHRAGRRSNGHVFARGPQQRGGCRCGRMRKFSAGMAPASSDLPTVRHGRRARFRQ